VVLRSQAPTQLAQLKVACRGYSRATVDPTGATFRIRKDELQVRPVWHQRAGLGKSPRAVPEQLAYLIEN
jgi:hypothetical protein